MNESAENTMFPLVGKRKRGYNTAEVDAFLEKARESFNGSGVPQVSSTDVRTQAFGYVKNGYETRFVDAALERLEDVFAAREARSVVEGEELLNTGNAAERAKELMRLNNELQRRAVRSGKRKFRRKTILAHGYKRSQVDVFMDHVADALSGASVLTPQAVREVAFATEFGGYDEAQVDAYLDALTSFLVSQVA